MSFARVYTRRPPCLINGGVVCSRSRPVAVPAGFFDDHEADAKARNVDVKELAAQQLETDWEAFQDFAAEVEQQSEQEQQQRQEETKQRDEEQKLDNMHYLDRYRLALERAAALEAGDATAAAERKRKLEQDEEAPAAVEEVATAVSGEDLVASYKKKAKRAKAMVRKKKARAASDSDSDSDLDPTNWRAKGI